MPARKGPRPKPGDKFNEWTVLWYESPKSFCRCSCGVEDYVANGALKFGSSPRCFDCGRKASAAARIGTTWRRVGQDLTTPVFRKLRLLVDNVLARCGDETVKGYENYGGRGISVYPEWLEDKDKFLVYLTTLEGYDNPNLVIDRIDNNGNYEPGNLRFATRKLSSVNRRRNYGHKLRKDSNGRFTKKH